MKKLGIRNHGFGGPTRIAVEASLDVVLKFGLDTITGEQFDHIDGVISIEMIERGTVVRISTVRTIEAWKRGEPNAGRATYDFPRETLAEIWA